MFRKFQTVIDLVCVTAFLCLFLGGQFLIDLLYTGTYGTAGRYVTILSLSFLALRFNTLVGLVMNTGNSRAMMITSGVRAIVLCVSLPLAYRFFGMHGALLAVALNPLVTAPYTLALVMPILGARQVRRDWLWLAVTLLVGILIMTFE